MDTPLNYVNGDMKSTADIIILFSEKSGISHRGGRHVEFGLAIGLKKRLIVIGPRENIFHCLPQVELFDSWEDFVDNGI
jgi:hypothetical protein